MDFYLNTNQLEYHLLLLQDTRRLLQMLIEQLQHAMDISPEGQRSCYGDLISQVKSMDYGFSMTYQTFSDAIVNAGRLHQNVEEIVDESMHKATDLFL